MAKRIQSFIYLNSVRIQALSDFEILNIVGPELLAEIKRKDAHPFFQAFSIAHEGRSIQPKILGEVNAPKISWTRQAIQTFKNIVTKGVKFFRGHNQDSSTDNRPVLGEVVADTQREIDGKLHHIVIAYHAPEVKAEAQQMDVCSQEAAWTFFDTAGKWVADKIDELTGIALANSSSDIPAFPGAKRLGMVQATIQAYNDTGGNSVDESSGKDKIERKNMITFKDVETAVRELNIHPSQLYSMGQLKADNTFKPEFDKMENLSEELSSRDETIKTLQQEKATQSRQMQLATAKERLAQTMKEGKLTPKQSAFAEIAFEEGLEDMTDEGLKAFVDKQIGRHAAYVKKTATLGSEVINLEDKNQDIIPGDDPTKAVNNELLDEDSVIE